MNFLLTILALACCISALPVLGMNLNWARSTEQKFSHYENLVAKAEAELASPDGILKSYKLEERILEKKEKQLKFAPTPEIAKQLDDFVQSRRQFKQLEDDYIPMIKKFGEMPSRTEQQIQAAKNLLKSHSKAYDEAKSKTPNLKAIDEFRNDLKVFEVSLGPRIMDEIRLQKLAPKPTFSESLVQMDASIEKLKVALEFNKQSDEVSKRLASALARLKNIPPNPLQQQQLFAVMTKWEKLDAFNPNLEQMKEVRDAVKALEDSLV